MACFCGVFCGHLFESEGAINLFFVFVEEFDFAITFGFHPTSVSVGFFFVDEIGDIEFKGHTEFVFANNCETFSTGR